jgi:Zn(2)-Cys(6) binuclear cluster domain-containing protein
MPPSNHRKSHTKSRKGCLQCKRRHAKCDEAKPTCSNCSRLDLKCVWPVPKESPNILSPSPTVSTLTPETRQLSTSSELAIDDMMLIHHWTLHASLVFDQTVKWPEVNLPWQDGIVRVGFRFPFLLRGILSLSAIHKATTIPTAERSSLILQSTKHIDIALQAFRDQLSHPNPEYAPAMFALAAILIVHHLAMAQIQSIKDPISELLGLFRLVKGVRVVLQGNWTSILNTEVGALLTAVKRQPVSGTMPEILSLHDLCDGRAPYKQAIDSLHEVFLEVRQAKIQNTEQSTIALLFIWPSAVQDDFIELVLAKDPIALIIIAYFTILLRIWGTAWWIKGWDRLIMGAVRDALPDSKYNKLLGWAQVYVPEELKQG